MPCENIESPEMCCTIHCNVFKQERVIRPFELLLAASTLHAFVDVASFYTAWEGICHSCITPSHSSVYFFSVAKQHPFGRSSLKYNFKL